MNAHQRRKFMVRKHRAMPLGSEVKVLGMIDRAKIFKHDAHRPNCCIIQFNDGVTQWVTLAQIKPVFRLKVRPWWRVHNDKARGIK